MNTTGSPSPEVTRSQPVRNCVSGSLGRLRKPERSRHKGSMVQPVRKNLIEVALPLEMISAAAPQEKDIRVGHPAILHAWWSRKPLAACRAVLFAQLVDDPSSSP